MSDDLYARGGQRDVLNAQLAGMPTWALDEAGLCELELLLSGAFAPLKGYLLQADYDAVLERARLRDGTPWGIPISVTVNEQFASGLGEQVALTDGEGVPLAVLEVAEQWPGDVAREAQRLWGAEDFPHRETNSSLADERVVHLGGKIVGLQPPVHYDFAALRGTPTTLRAHYAELDWQRVAGYIPEFLVHPSEVEQCLQQAALLGAGLLIAPVAGPVSVDERNYYARLRCLEAAAHALPAKQAVMRLLALAERGDSSRRMLTRLHVLRNLGCTHVILPTDSIDDEVRSQADELGLEVVSAPFDSPVTESLLQAAARGDCQLDAGAVYPEVERELERLFPPPRQCGYTVFFTGLSGSGKSTIANALAGKLRAREGRRVTLLDGDLVRMHLSSELGFSRRDRNLNIQRIGFVAQQIAGNGGAAICAPIAPYAATRRLVRSMIEPLGGFLEIHVATPLEVCEQRDRKGLYAKARAGLIKEFTGIDDPYEVPESPELRIDTTSVTADEAADEVIALLEERGYL